jgi:hypothetical protein
LNREKSARWYARDPEAKREKCRKKNASYRAKDPEATREINRRAAARWRAENPAKHLLCTCRNSAKTRDLEFALRLEDLEAMLAPMVCAVTGLPLSVEHPGGSARNPWAPSVDRIDCSRGYVAGNVRLVCWAFNQMRGDFPDEVVRTLVDAAHRALHKAH